MILNMSIIGGNPTKSTLIITIETDSTVQLYSDNTYQTVIKTALEKNTGEYWFSNLDNGTYYIKAIKETKSQTQEYTINEFGVYRINMSYRTVPEFTYIGGNYEVVQDDDTIIDPTSYNGTDWKIRFLTSGTLNFSNLLGAKDGIDVFLVGGGGGGGNAIWDAKVKVTLGGGGGGGGETTTARNISVTEGTDYSIVIGAGGVAQQDGGASSAFNETADAGLKGLSNGASGAGGSSGGGDSGYASSGGNGGSDGATGVKSGGSNPGAGQGTTTREFGGYVNTVNTDVSAASAFVLGSEPTDTEKAFLVSGKYLTLEQSGVTRTGIQNVFPIVSYDNSTRTVTLDTTYQTITASAGDTVRFGNLYAGGGGGGSSNHGYSPYNGGTGGFGGGGTGGGASSHDGTAGTTNTGGGGGAGAPGYGPYNGGSGIVIIRNAR